MGENEMKKKESAWGELVLFDDRHRNNSRLQSKSSRNIFFSPTRHSREPVSTSREWMPSILSLDFKYVHAYSECRSLIPANVNKWLQDHKKSNTNPLSPPPPISSSHPLFPRNTRIQHPVSSSSLFGWGASCGACEQDENFSRRFFSLLCTHEYTMTRSDSHLLFVASFLLLLLLLLHRFLVVFYLLLLHTCFSSGYSLLMLSQLNQNGSHSLAGKFHVQGLWFFHFHPPFPLSSRWRCGPICNVPIPCTSLSPLASHHPECPILSFPDACVCLLLMSPSSSLSFLVARSISSPLSSLLQFCLNQLD